MITSVTLTEERRASNRLSTEGTCTQIIRALMISVVPAVPIVSAHQCLVSVPHQCHISVPI
ncbi:unnamed protein product [Staurois parvus]|uniref:Uncharacterized protein n=1 Tax=Staurois parvus TaxID=386267 RepID=A0ABN9HEF2_9NEOB|nr:unnamed protein product [Staurois parvus]